MQYMYTQGAVYNIWISNLFMELRNASIKNSQEYKNFPVVPTLKKIQSLREYCRLKLIAFSYLHARSVDSCHAFQIMYEVFALW